MPILKTSLNTVKNKIAAANAYETAITSSNTYIGIGRVVPWDGTTIPQIYDTTEELNNVFRGLVALKKINSSDINLVAPRVDWETGIEYTEYSENLDLFSYDSSTQINGTVSASSGSNVVTGSSTLFETTLAMGDFITLYGNGNTSPEVTKEIVSVLSNTSVTVNSVFSASYSANTLYKVENTYPKYANNYYVRNKRDQIFICLLSSGQSTVMPEINVSGDLPENPYIETSDGYKWKYLYTIPSGSKEKFLTSEWMPVITDTYVQQSAVDGRLGIFKVIDGGDGYLGGSSNSVAGIVVVRGDGTGANLTANVYNGVVVSVSPLGNGSTNLGQNYTFADISFSDGNKTVNSNIANVIAVIAPQNGHGANPYAALGAKNLMISVELDSDEGNTIPISVGSQSFDYHQISIIQNPESSVEDVAYLGGTRYKAVHVIKTTSGVPNTFALDETVYQGSNTTNYSFSGVVVNWDSNLQELWLNNVVGTYDPTAAIKAATSGTSTYGTSITAPEYVPFTGDILYVEDRTPIHRDYYQAEQIKLVLSF